MKPLTWDQYFIALAKISSMRSKDPNTKVGAILVNSKNRVIGLGYNGMPKGNDKDFPWEREGKKSQTKYPYVIHAEMNAILNAIKSVENTKLYVSLFPCSNCVKFIVQAGISEIIYDNDQYLNTEDNLIAKKILDKCKIKYQKIDSIKIKIN